MVTSTRIAAASVGRPPSPMSSRFCSGASRSATQAATENTRMNGLKTQNASSRISASETSSGVSRSRRRRSGMASSTILAPRAAQSRLTASGSSFVSSSPGRRGKVSLQLVPDARDDAHDPVAEARGAEVLAQRGGEPVPESPRAASRGFPRPRSPRRTGSPGRPGSARRCARRSPPSPAGRSPLPQRGAGRSRGPGRRGRGSRPASATPRCGSPPRSAPRRSPPGMRRASRPRLPPPHQLLEAPPPPNEPPPPEKPPPPNEPPPPEKPPPPQPPPQPPQ